MNILSFTDQFEDHAPNFKIKRIAVLVTVLWVACLTSKAKADDDNQVSDDWKRWCNMEGVKDPLWDCDRLRRGNRYHLEHSVTTENGTTYTFETDHTIEFNTGTYYPELIKEERQKAYAPVTPGYGVGEGLRLPK